MGWELHSFFQRTSNTPVTKIFTKEKSLDKYTIENLSKREPVAAEIKIEETLKKDPKYTSYLFSFKTGSPLSGEASKKITGQLNIPNGVGLFPSVLMIRGYVDKEIYQTGIGTKKSAEVFAKNGFITIAPDFLGYAGSGPETNNVFEARFQTYTTVLDLFASLQSIEKWDGKNIFIWGHSNGGQIALTILEITGNDYPTTLWAPVSKPFPFSILAYTDEASDSGKYLRGQLAKFEQDYDTDLYSIHKYLNKINTPIQINQGTADISVPYWWSKEFVKNLKDLKKEVLLNLYPGADHNLLPFWNQAVASDLLFFKKHLNKD